ncbi:MAG: TIGR03088 family PEP-CTERM/XrtA system glycosyltransferase [Methylococcaceae bacterium]
MSRKLVFHLIYRFDVGGLETVLVNLINTLPTENFKHVIVSLTNSSEQMKSSIKVNNVELIDLHKQPGNDLKIHWKLWRLFRQYHPQIVHSYNMAALEYQFIAFLAGVPLRIHAEHGRDIFDLDGSNKKYQIFRQLINPFVHYWIPVSQELASWLKTTVKIPEKKVQLIYNGIDLNLYQPITRLQKDIFTIGTVGRAVPVKNQLMLIQAVAFLLKQQPDLKNKLRLIIVGNGELLPKLRTYIDENQLQENIELLGERHDVYAILKTIDLFVLPSLAEGIALTLLEAMASGLPIIATNVGGNPELIESGVNGQLIPSENTQALADSILYYVNNFPCCEKQGIASRKKVETYFNLQAMTKNYFDIYEGHEL